MLSQSELITVVATLAEALDELARETVELDECCSETRCRLCGAGHTIECPIGQALAMLAPDPS